MKIKDIKINNFGKLSNKEIKFCDGINIIYGNNESGKSTLLKFLMGMFFGLSKNKNGKFISDIERYTPWNGGEFSGKLKYTLDDGSCFEVFRDFKKKNPKIFNQNFEDISSNFNIDKNNGIQFFQNQTGVDEELFSSTIVSFQEEVKLDEKEQSSLVQKMSNLVSTGEDNLSFNKIMNKLNKKQTEEIGSSRTLERPINIVSKRMKEIREEKEYLSNFKNKQYKIDETKEELEKRIKEQERELELLRKLKQIKDNQELEKEKIKINNNGIKEYKRKIEKLQYTTDKAKKNANQDNEENKSIDVRKIKSLLKSSMLKGIILSIIFIILTLVSLFIIKNDIISAISIVLTIVITVYVGYLNYKTKIRKIKHDENKEEQIITNQNEIEILKNALAKLEEETNNLTKKTQDEYDIRFRKNKK